ncbi:hypothetical protein D0869_08780 [Hortaea werneckii]|uniref:Tudor domain-containing protein n=2 Tax=Hortaea werneckii TaxID=91943 RepID=A0A3M6WJN4_HORWE|nr:hypothetical protein KC334_g799 [Hortaea werneckii]RMX78813.1 hypothetical protein D0869_08780 [Hortaea werneckii]RMY34019.1 hypothetical protein D0866_05535 [Hortaea werneckii]
MGNNALDKIHEELAECEGNIKTCDEMLALEPEDESAKETKSMMEDMVKDLKQQITAEKAKQSAVAPPPPPPSEDAPPPPPDEPQQPTIFNVKDTVMAKYSEDKQWYQATIVTRTGSQADPVYTVTFKGYGNTETKRKYEIRPVHVESKKRKADASPAVSVPQTPAPPMPATGGGHIISAAPAVDTSLVREKREPSKVSDGPTRMAPEPKKLKGNKALEKGKASWNDWQKSGPKKPATGAVKKKESMFKTPDNPNARVGFTGSGKAMTKDQTRSKWNYGPGPEED